MKLILPNVPTDHIYDVNDMTKLFKLNCNRTTNAMIAQCRIPAPNLKGQRHQNLWSHGHMRKFNGKEFDTPKRYKQ